MANTYLTSNLIAKEAVAILKAMNSFVRLGNRRMENMFQKGDYAPGNTINVRLDNFFNVERGDTITGSSIVEKSLPVTIGPLYSVGIPYTPTDLQRNIISFSKEVLEPSVRAIAAKINNDIFAAATKQLYYYTGSIGAPINSYASLTAPIPKMDMLNMNNYNRIQCIDPITGQQVRQNSTLQNSFLPSLNKSITVEGSLGRLIGNMEIMQDSSISAFVSGTHDAAGSITVSGAVTSGNTILLSGFNSGATVVEGDLFSVQGVYIWDSVKQQSTPYLAQFVVQTGGTAGGGGTISVTVSPEIIVTGPRKNISTASIPNGAVINFVTNSTTGYMRQIAFTDRALVLCMPPLQPMDSPYSATHTADGISMRVSKMAEVMDNKNIFRLDAQAAIAWMPDQAVQNLGQLPSVV